MSTHRPNILFLFADQLNARCMSCAGHPDVQTPHLDRLASEGVRFANAYAQSPLCTPSRICYLSSLYPSTHGYYGLYGREPTQNMTSMFRYFKEQGYRTGALGKLHTPRYWVERDCQFVYDEFIEHPKYLEAVGLYDKNDNRQFVPGRDGKSSLLPLEHSCEVVLAKQARRFFRNEGEPNDRGDSNAPWMAWVSFARPHSPTTPSEPYASMYPPESLTLPGNAIPAMREEQANRIRELPGHVPLPDEEGLRKRLGAYLGLVSQVDYGIGLVLKELEQRQELDNTIIVFANDHGDYAGEFGLWSKIGGISTRAITRVVMMVRFPEKVRAAQVRDEIVETVDLFPTLCELAGLEIPDHVQGKSFVPLLHEDPQPIRESALTENARRKALATKRWRFVANIDGQQDELYDQENDPWELDNCAGKPAYAEVLYKMQRDLLDRLARAQRPITMVSHSWHHEYDRDGRVKPDLLSRTDPYD